jgi:hypothetical protein
MSQMAVSNYMQRLAYRRAVLIERAENIFMHKMRLPRGWERHQANEEMILIGWELREIERHLPRTGARL